MSIEISAFFAPTRATPGHIRLAEELGFARAWCYASPVLYDDVFVTLARAAEQTSRIGLGVGVLVPGLRTPVVTASALSTVAALAPGRVAVAVGAGFTGRVTLALPPVRTARLATEVADLRALLAGGEVAHPEGGAPVRRWALARADLRVLPGAAGAGTRARGGRRCDDGDLLSGRAGARSRGRR